MKKIFNYLAVILLLVGGFTACDSNDEILERPLLEDETYTLSVNFTSLAGDIQVLLDGEPLAIQGGFTSGKNITTQTPEILLTSKGERTLELRDVKQDRVVWDSTFVGATGQNCLVKKYWNGEAVTNELEMPSPQNPGNIGFLLQIETGETLIEPMDIEFFYMYIGEDWMNYLTEQPLDIAGDDDNLINGYVPGSGFSSFIEVPALRPYDANWQVGDMLYMRIYKAGTNEPYNTLMVRWGYNEPDECFIATSLSHDNLAGSTSAMITISEQPDSYFLNGEFSMQGNYISNCS